MGAVAYAHEARDFTERIRALIDSVDYRQAITDEEREAVYRLRYHGYLAENAIAANFGRRLSDKFDDLDNTWIFGVFIAGELASTIRLTIASTAHAVSPALETFPDVLDGEIRAGRIIVDPTRFVVDRRFSRLYPDLRYATTRLAWMACLQFSADMLLAAVRTEHQAFYKRVFGHRLVSPARPFPMLSKPISLMACDFAKQRSTIDERYPFFRSTYFERRMLFEPATTVRWERDVEPSPQMVAALAG